MRIRELQEKESDRLYEALKRSAEENGIGNRISSDKEMLEDAIFKEKHSFTLAAEIDNRIVAYLLYSMTRRNFMHHPAPGFYIHGMYVEIPYRRQKIGTRLIESLVDIANEKKIGRIEFALLRNNTVGERFLESLSFKEIDFIKPMRLILNDNSP